MSLGIITRINPKSPISEAYRTLRTNLQFSDVNGNLNVIAITSSGPAEGKTITLCNVAQTYVQAGKRVVILDGDLRKPRLHKVFQLSNNEGLTNILTNQRNIQDVIQVNGDGMRVITSGPIPPNPSELLGSDGMKKLIDQLAQQFDIVLIDLPPVGIVTDAAVVSQIVDGTILVVASHRTQIDNAKRSKQLLDQVGAKIIGVVMTMIPVSKKGYYGYQYYAYDQEEIKTKKRKLRLWKKRI